MGLNFVSYVIQLLLKFIFNIFLFRLDQAKRKVTSDCKLKTPKLLNK